MRVGLHRRCDAVNTGASSFGSTLALHSIECRAVRIVARFAIKSKESAKSGDGAHFGSEERKRNVGAKNEIDFVWLLADRTSPVLVG